MCFRPARATEWDIIVARQNTSFGHSDHAWGTVRLNDRALIPERSFLYKKKEEDEQEEEEEEDEEEGEEENPNMQKYKKHYQPLLRNPQSRLTTIYLSYLDTDPPACLSILDHPKASSSHLYPGL